MLNLQQQQQQKYVQQNHKKRRRSDSNTCNCISNRIWKFATLRRVVVATMLHTMQLKIAVKNNILKQLHIYDFLLF